ncbi:MAG: hypothetical protein WKF31_12485 [Thermoleophilaceae bacterium]
MAIKTKAAKKGAVSAGQAVRDNEYLQRLIEDAALRDNLRDAYESARKAYGRINGKGPAKALFDDKKTQKELQNAAVSLRAAADGLSGKKKKKKRRGGKLLILLVGGAVAALFASEDLRKKALDLVFGAEEEFEYTATTTPQTAAPPPPPQPTV